MVMNNENEYIASRRSFLAFTGTLIASIGGFSLKDLLRAESLAALHKRNEPAISLSQDAINEIWRIIRKYDLPSLPSHVLRIGIEGTEASGYRAYMGFESQSNGDRDIAISFQGIPVVVARECLELLRGTRVTMAERNGMRGFLFTGPLFDNHDQNETKVAQS
jgi:Fe-S cluster assembly iron-binding protein IscA